MNTIGSLTLRGPVFARHHSWTRSVMHPDTRASKLTYTMKYGYDETNADNTIAYTGNYDAYIYRHLNDCISYTVMISLQSLDSLCVCIIMMHDRCSCFHMNTLHVFMALFMLISMMLI